MGKLYLYLSVKGAEIAVTLITLHCQLQMVAEVKKEPWGFWGHRKIFMISSDKELTWTGFKPGSQSIPYC